MLTPERRHEKRIVMDDFGFDHADAINLLIDTKNKLEIATKALEELQNFTRPEGFIKTTIEEALKQIRGSDAD